MSFLTIENLHFSFENEVLFEDFYLELKKGELHAFLGASGCGKSTLLHILAGFLEPQRGKITLDGVVLFDKEASINLAPEQRGVGIVFQEHSLFPHLSVKENILFGQKKLKSCDSWLRLMRLEEKAHQFPGELSGGQQQRVAIARSLAAEPKLVLLDESFSSLDKQLRDELRFEIQDLFKEKNLTSILVTHSQEEAFSFGDRISVLSKTSECKTGSLEEILRNPSDQEMARFLGAGVIFHRGEGKDFFAPFECLSFGEGDYEGALVGKLYQGRSLYYKIHSPNGDFEPFMFEASAIPAEQRKGKVLKFQLVNKELIKAFS